MRKAIFTALFVAMVVVTGHAAGNDNATPLPGEDRSSPSGSPSYYEGVWVGMWTGWRDPTISQDVTVRIDKGRKEGFFRVEYSWGATRGKSGAVPPGSIRTRGEEAGDQFVFKWKSKQGRDFSVTLKKHKDDVVKARLEKSGPLDPNEMGYAETYLNRK